MTSRIRGPDGVSKISIFRRSNLLQAHQESSILRRISCAAKEICSPLDRYPTVVASSSAQSDGGCTKTNITKYMYRNMYLPHHSMYFRRRRCLYGMAELPETAELGNGCFSPKRTFQSSRCTKNNNIF